ncbi:hypothetical protein LPJ78_005568 [Coemansia sp. RSA 989]|nr:hypothetical protein BX667DRAFT_516537 [Coemansia mojavensis]KAJ1738540.1 hypothetical protein LPJ68_005462 [Coemansia sp. RSA 1086]KAJ1746532.1 hypothetical protein LPJ79_005829 [Coemansia sp. RSA 1821]KAJ1861042.1 hypothetical protein LPJ78_005568 [Coemansia sp. RSA 989]KAJ1873563.1 hypothetical protein LPJ55_002225 [Coemansia sp. RSA 990]KAJ2668656.1 hypothetical protein IWW42_005049 [Coemansia sp. RSA 1085]
MTQLKLECSNCLTAGNETEPEWSGPHCLETDSQLQFVYGNDGLQQCSIKQGTPFHRLLSATLPICCRLSTEAETMSEFPLYASTKGNYNVVLHGHKSRVVGAAIYAVGRPLPNSVPGVTTMQFNTKWYEGTGLSTLMANKRHQEEFIISPIVAIMFCILSACVVYVIGRVYVESYLIPQLLKQQGTKKTD